jgi:hypothetical protein
MFYDELKKELEKLVAEQNFTEAWQIIQEELKMPYIPRDFEQFLQNLQQEILAKLPDDHIIRATRSQLGMEEIAAKLLSENLIDRTLAIQSLKNINVRPLLPVIQQYLLNPTFGNDTKTLILLILADQQITDKIKLEKNGQIFELVPTSLNTQSLFDFFEEVKTKIQIVIGDKNPSITKNAQNFTLIFLMNRYPQLDDLASENLVAAMIKTAYEALGLSLE